MKRISNEELKEIQINILNEIDAFCKNNNIQYWIDSGTLLGAIRHKGYIPWDNDIDVGMLREDYEKFISTYNNFDNQYELHCFENDLNHFYSFAKVYDTNTVLYEPDMNGDKISVFVDVFVYDNAPLNEKELRKMYRKRDFYTLCNNLYRLNNFSNKNIIKIAVIKTIKKILSIKPRRYYVSKLIQNSKKYQNTETNLVGNFTAITKISADKNILKSFTEKEFEGKYYPVPERYDDWLKIFYGDYMKIPPKEKQIVHVFDAFYNDK